MFDFINQAFGYVLRFFYSLIPNYAVALLLFALFVKVILFPLGIKQQKNMVKQASLRPKEAAIRKKYAGRTDKVTQQKLNEEIMSLYQSENFSPMSGCLPMLIQLPIIFILYEVIRRPLKYLCMFTDETLTKIGDICKELNPDMMVNIKNDIEFIEPIKNNFDSFKEVLGEFSLADLPNFGLFGGAIDLSQTPTVALNWLILIPILTFIFQFFSMKLTRKFTYQAPATAGGPDVGKSMKIMDYTMPLMTVWISFMMPAVIAMYWIYQNIFSVLQQFILSKMYPIPTFTEEELKRLEKEYGGNTKKEKKKVRSLHNIDKDDDVSEQAEKAAVPEQTSAPLSIAQMKDESDKKKGKDTIETAQTEKKKVRSLHHIDDEGYENGYKIDGDEE